MIGLITMTELERLTNKQLQELRIALHRLLAMNEPETANRRNILSTLENIDTIWHYHAQWAIRPDTLTS
ncbi:hypothetical protein [uncultured Roseobacter sp.]|uniref:hypothetical protein n=1 Tax=uncultured Roseobacter sp. TaxID=114847 RepID=UPI0026046B29|nr:hypothetical protein [uncultured Roseobacter sp.]